MELNITSEQRAAVDAVRTASACVKNVGVPDTEIINAVKETPEPTCTEIEVKVARGRKTK